jgi:UDPglucose 6-dehydrogenase
MRLTIIGTGYVGLVTGTCLADNGNDVVCVDINAKKISRLQKGLIPIYEPGLDDLVKRNVNAERLRFTTELSDGVQSAAILFICVGTPPSETGGPDMRYVYQAAEDIAREMTSHKIIVMKSTVPVGTAAEVTRRMAALTDIEFDVVSNPEFMKEGAAIQDFLKPDRIVIGTRDARVATLMKELYAPFVRTGNPMLVMDNESAELTKYGANALLATRISFMNELANFADLMGADIDSVRQGMGYDQRIGHAFLFPGVGYGGSCFPKDVDALVYTADQNGQAMHILAATNKVNRAQKSVLFHKLTARLGPDLTGVNIAMWGLAFKPNTDDIREAPALTLIRLLINAGATLTVFDPEATENTRQTFGGRIQYATRQYHALNEADALLIVTEWNQFRRPDWDKIGAAMRGRLIFDGRNIYSPTVVEAKGYEYYGIGRGRALPKEAPCQQPSSPEAQDSSDPTSATDSSTMDTTSSVSTT